MYLVLVLQVCVAYENGSLIMFLFCSLSRKHQATTTIVYLGVLNK